MSRGSGVGRYVEVCAGAGGWALGLRRAGWGGTGIEIDPRAAEAHRANVGPCITSDVTSQPSPHDADLVCGGVPCQPFSMSGNRGGLKDPRGQLFRSLIRHAVDASARCVAMENVRGLLSSGAMPVVLREFKRAGFKTDYRIVNSADFGVAQTRLRLFIVGFRSAEDMARFRWPTPTHSSPKDNTSLPAWRTIAQVLGLPSGVREVLDRPSLTITTGDGAGHTGGPEIFTSQRFRKELREALFEVGAINRKEGNSLTLPTEWVASLQSFPPGFNFVGSNRSKMSQIGNAVAPLVGEAVSTSLWQALYGGDP